MEELKPCPFCGGAAHMDRENIYCDCGAVFIISDFMYRGEAMNHEEARQMTKEAWNKRVNDTEVTGIWAKVLGLYECSECECVCEEMLPYCPDCGAKMEGK